MTRYIDLFSALIIPDLAQVVYSKRPVQIVHISDATRYGEYRIPTDNNEVGVEHVLLKLLD